MITGSTRQCRAPSLASGVQYVDGSAEEREGGLYLYCNTRAGDTLAFELLPWEITYTLTFSDESMPEVCFFMEEELNQML